MRSHHNDGRFGFRGIVFDMDNTLLQSRIDFDAMKEELFQFLIAKEAIAEDTDLHQHTPSTLIVETLAAQRLSDSMIAAMWEIPKKYELAGMQDAELEPGVTELLQELHGKLHMAIVTNNSVDAAQSALQRHDILRYFEHLVGREMMDSMKPSPDGYALVLDYYKDIAPEEWLSVGDSWIDGKGSIEAGMTFIAYQGDLNKMHQMGVYPTAHIMNIQELMAYI